MPRLEDLPREALVRVLCCLPIRVLCGLGFTSARFIADTVPLAIQATQRAQLPATISREAVAALRRHSMNHLEQLDLAQCTWPAVEEFCRAPLPMLYDLRLKKVCNHRTRAATTTALSVLLSLCCNNYVVFTMLFSLCLIHCTAMRCFTQHATTLHTARHYCALISVLGWQCQLGDSECSRLVSTGCWDLRILDLTGCEAVSNSTCITVSLFASGLEQLSIRGTGMHCALSAGTLWYYQALCFACRTASAAATTAVVPASGTAAY